MKQVVLLAAVLVLPFYQAQACSELQVAKKKVYGFRPSELTQEQQEKKSEELNRFWKDVKANGARGADCLREMILAENEDKYFLFDASALLYSLDRSNASLPAVLHGLSHASLKEVNPLGYIRFALTLSQQGVDIGHLAEKYLTYPSVDTFVPQHAMKLDREMGAIILYGSMPPGQVDKYLAAAISAKEPYARSTAALLLALNMTKESFRILSSLQNLGDLPPSIREQVQFVLKYSDVNEPGDKRTYSRKQILERISRYPHYGNSFWSVSGDKDFETSAIATLLEEDLPLVREARQKSITSVSDEALYEYSAWTKILFGVINRLDLYKEYRIHY